MLSDTFSATMLGLSLPQVVCRGLICYCVVCVCLCMGMSTILSYYMSVRSEFRYEFPIKAMFGSSLRPVVSRRDHVLFMLFVFVFA